MNEYRLHTADCKNLRHFVAGSIGMFLLVLVVNGQSLSGRPTPIERSSTKSGASPVQAVPLPTPTFFEHFSGNPTCATIAARYPSDNVIDPNGLKLDFSGVYSDLFYFVSYTSSEGSVVLQGTTATTPPGYIQIATSGTNSIDSFSSQKPITAVMIKAGNEANVWYYNIPGYGYTLTGGNLTASNPQGTSHIIFCFEQPLNPSAAGSNVGGRVTSAVGSGLSGVTVRLENPTTGDIRFARTSPFGYYYFEDVPSGESYVVSVTDRRYGFLNGSRVFTLFDSVSDIDFVASP